MSIGWFFAAVFAVCGAAGWLEAIRIHTMDERHIAQRNEVGAQLQTLVGELHDAHEQIGKLRTMVADPIADTLADALRESERELEQCVQERDTARGHETTWRTAHMNVVAEYGNLMHERDALRQQLADVVAVPAQEEAEYYVKPGAATQLAAAPLDKPKRTRTKAGQAVTTGSDGEG